MAGIFDIKVRGLNGIFRNLEKASTKTLQNAENRMYVLTSKAAGKTRRAMRNWIWDTGNLAGSIDNMVKWGLGALQGFVFTPVKYGIYVHFGTYRMKKRPYMDIALNYLLTNSQTAFKGLI